MVAPRRRQRVRTMTFCPNTIGLANVEGVRSVRRTEILSPRSAEYPWASRRCRARPHRSGHRHRPCLWMPAVSHCLRSRSSGHGKWCGHVPNPRCRLPRSSQAHRLWSLRQQTGPVGDHVEQQLLLLIGEVGSRNTCARRVIARASRRAHHICHTLALVQSGFLLVGERRQECFGRLSRSRD